MPDVNAVGDLVLTDPRVMRELADPLRLELHDHLRRRSPATVRDLASLLSSRPAAIRDHLEALETVGLVECQEHEADPDESRWSAVGRGFVFEIPEDPAGQAAARQLSNAMLLHYLDVPRQWVAQVEPQLGLDWARSAGLLNTRLVVTPNELRDLQVALERLLEPFLTRAASATPTAARHVRVLGYFMPEDADQEESGGRGTTD
jgi:DNA-binding transcriptional ArsR family regulator